MQPDQILECAMINLHYAHAEIRQSGDPDALARAKAHVKEALCDLAALDLICPLPKCAF